MGRLKVLTIAGLGLVVAATAGTETLRANPPVPPVREANAANRSAEPDADLPAARSLAAALSALTRGEREVARRQLETLVERFPETRAADHGRKVLAEISGGTGRTGGATLDQRIVASDPAPGALAPPASKPVVGQMQSLQEDLRIVAGDRLFYAAGAIEPGGAANAVIAAQVRWLKRHASLLVEVEGHADDPGLDMKRLSLERATRVRDLLLAGGIEPKRVSVRAVGRTQPVATCEEPACAAQNRRVVVVVVGRDLAKVPQR